jgi:hypothetical protein
MYVREGEPFEFHRATIVVKRSMGRFCASLTNSVSFSIVAIIGLTACGNTDSDFLAAVRDASVPTDGPILTFSSDAPGSTFSSDGPGLVFGDATVTGDDASGSEETGPAVTSLTIQPQNPEIDVSIVNGQIASVALAGDAGSALPLAFTAVANGGQTVAAAWAFDRGDLGTITATGGFTASGNYAGQGTVTAVYGHVVATTTLTVKIQSTQNGSPATGLSDAGVDGAAGDAGTSLGGNNGVGGNLLGGPVDSGTLARLQGTATAPTTAAQLGLLYPYDQTVWPRGILAPLLQWQTTLNATAVSIHLSEANFDFVGTYAGSALVNDPIEQGAWAQATSSNGGDPLVVELRVDDGTTTYGPVTESWTIAAGVLQGTVYYNSYNSAIINGGVLNGQQVGAVLSIAPGATNPQLAVASTNNGCYVCHTVSANGSTIIMQGPGIRNQDPPTLDQTSVYSLVDGGTLVTHYSDYGNANQDKPDWGALYPDGTMFVANSRDGFHAYQGNSDLFPTGTADVGPLASTGFTDVVTQAVTPAFSPDGRLLAFSFFAGPGTTGVQPSAGQTLALMHFDCGAATGSVACTGGNYAFSGLTLLDSETNRYLGWPSILPGDEGVIYQTTLVAPNGGGGSNLYTWNGAEAQITWASVPASGASSQHASLGELNGFNTSGTSYLPTVAALHGTDPSTGQPLDTELNYEPTVNPIPTGGYYWVVFTSRRAYGNVLTGDPFADESQTGPQPFTKKLWISAFDANPVPGKDPSHPAFYLPGQELLAGNMRGYWSVSPCKADGSSCSTGADCCGGYCEQAASGQLVCGNSTPMGCSQEYETCMKATDCCNTSDECVNGRCSLPAPPPPPPPPPPK